MDQILPVVYMIGVLLLVLPAFLQSNSKLKQFLTNLTIWIIVVLIILTIIYIFKKWVKFILKTVIDKKTLETFILRVLILLFIILSSCSTPNSRSDAYYEAVVGHIAQTVLSGDCNSKCISSIVNSDLKYATYTQAINVIDKVSKLLPSIYDAIKKELVVKVDEKYKKSL